MRFIKSLLTMAVTGILFVASSVLVLAANESGSVVRVLSDVAFYSSAGDRLGSASEYLSQIDGAFYTYAFSQTGVIVRSAEGHSYILTNAVCVSPEGLKADTAKGTSIAEMKAAYKADTFEIKTVVYGANEVKVPAALVGADASLDCAVLVTEQEVPGQPATIQSSRSVMVDDAVMSFCYSSKPYRDGDKTEMVSSAGNISAVSAVGGIDVFATTVSSATGSSDGPLFLDDGTMAGFHSSALSAKSNGRMAVQGDRIAEFLGSLKLTFSYSEDSRAAASSTNLQNSSVFRTGLIVLGCALIALVLVLVIRAVVKRSHTSQATKPVKATSLASVSQPAAVRTMPPASPPQAASHEDATTVLGVSTFATLGSSSGDNTSVLSAPVQASVEMPVNAYAGGTTLFVPDEEDGEEPGIESDTDEEKGAVIIRRKNHDRISISKPMFRVGKDGTRVDYCISDNPAISRSHAVFVRKGNGYYLIDNRTTNHTYLNGTLVPPNVEIRLTDGCVIRMADEDFDFQLI